MGLFDITADWNAFNQAMPQSVSPVNQTSPFLPPAVASPVVTAPGTEGGGFLDGFLQQRGADGMTSGGWGTAALGVASGLANAWMGMQQYGLAKDTLKASKDQFNKNYAAQKQTTNASLEDRQRARVASNPGAYQSVGTYMDQNGIK